MKTPHTSQQTVQRNGNAREALTRDLKRSHGRIQRRGGRLRHSAIAQQKAQESPQNKKNERSRSHQPSRTSRRLQRQRYSEAGEQTRQRDQRSVLIVSRTRCCKQPIRGASAPTANQQSRSATMLSSGVGGGQKRTTES